MKLVWAPFAARRGPDADAMRKIALDAYDECCLDYCCDPCEMAECLGLEIETSVEPCLIIGGTLFFERHPSRRIAGYGAFSALGRFLFVRKGQLFSPAAHAIVTHELILPRRVSRAVSSTELGELQPFAPIDVLQDIYMSHRGSGSMGAAQLGQTTG